MNIGGLHDGPKLALLYNHLISNVNDFCISPLIVYAINYLQQRNVALSHRSYSTNATPARSEPIPDDNTDQSSFYNSSTYAYITP